MYHFIFSKISWKGKLPFQSSPQELELHSFNHFCPRICSHDVHLGWDSRPGAKPATCRSTSKNLPCSYIQKQLTFQAHTWKCIFMLYNVYIYINTDDFSNSALVWFSTSSMQTKNLPNSSGQFILLKLNLTIFCERLSPYTSNLAKVGVHYSITVSYHAKHIVQIISCKTNHLMHII